mmetsp:Transcript_25193/g.41460  ORF Transcript_25193/g.41460 Transcript_25193/m.41460 type:complete len:116 (-) Transcript_25193:514-861(-)
MNYKSTLNYKELAYSQKQWYWFPFLCLSSPQGSLHVLFNPINNNRETAILRATYGQAGAVCFDSIRFDSMMIDDHKIHVSIHDFPVFISMLFRVSSAKAKAWVPFFSCPCATSAT